jgi:hypothetical protein
MAAVVVVVCPEKEWNRWAEDGFEAVKRLMPVKLFPAHKSVDGCSKLQVSPDAQAGMWRRLCDYRFCRHWCWSKQQQQPEQHLLNQPVTCYPSQAVC